MMSISNVGSFGTQMPAAPQGQVQAAPAPAAPADVQPDVQLQALPRQAPNQQQIQQALQEMKRVVEPATSNSLSFSIDHDTGKTIVKVTDVQTGDVIRQIPSEELLEIARSIDKMQGLLLRQKA